MHFLALNAYLSITHQLPPPPSLLPLFLPFVCFICLTVLKSPKMKITHIHIAWLLRGGRGVRTPRHRDLGSVHVSPCLQLQSAVSVCTW